MISSLLLTKDQGCFPLNVTSFDAYDLLPRTCYQKSLRFFFWQQNHGHQNNAQAKAAPKIRENKQPVIHHPTGSGAIRRNVPEFVPLWGS